ncbi:phage tail-collar fiber domain-containing protein [Providencia sp. PROV071]|uniref:phage tail-collar fiber domain-containing protein n=1 Tax=Providencia sp. PROV071 TaxID=2949796 RepID=UPI002349766A|nr:phage tail protein [Providencia sp. PROV071]
MKYFALLTKLGENLLAQATALGTKIELTQMAVGDGGGKLPTPDTNQTKLIAEKRRAAINTLFIDDNNKNQIVAEQIIPEQEGGWWIREIGLFDKAGNLIAVANCPETYKPQLAEGSGRTQSIRMVLIVSHTESVTLKIDPSVVLATREYVNTEITVLDKRIDALSAQTKLDLNKKFDKANISGQKGNDNDKVPSLDLFTTEVGNLQPKGDYAPAGDYATNIALTNGLGQKLNTSSVVQSPGASTTQVMSQDAVTKALRSSELIQSANQIIRDTNGNVSDFNNAKGNAVFFGYATALNNAAITGVGIDIAQVNNDYHLQLISAFHGNGIAFRTKNGDTKTWSDWSKFFHTGNVKVDRNGNLKTNDTSDALSDCCVGTPLPWPQDTVPSGFLACNGQSFNKATYPLLAAAYPSGKLPDLRGEFIRGLDAGRNVDNGRAALSAQGDAIRKIEGEIGQVIIDGDIAKNSGAFANLREGGLASDGSKYRHCSASFDSSRVVPTAEENRPRNIAFLYIVRAA